MILITDEPLDPEATTALVCKRSNGAVVTFLGVTRDTTADRGVLHLEYEAYRPMADKKLAEIAREVSEEWQVEDVAIAHRVGAWRSAMSAWWSPWRLRTGRTPSRRVSASWTASSRQCRSGRRSFSKAAKYGSKALRTSPCENAKLSPRTARYKVVSQRWMAGLETHSAIALRYDYVSATGIAVHPDCRYTILG